jgi:hypothetical protein
MTLNSTVGLEAALHGKPVMVFAPALYSHKGFTYEIIHDEEISSTLDVLLNDWQPDEKYERNLLNFLAFLLQYYLIPADGMQTADVYERYLNDCTSIDDKIGTNDFLYKKISDKEQEMKDVMRANICLSQSEGSMKQRIKTAIKKYFNS